MMKMRFWISKYKICSGSWADDNNSEIQIFIDTLNFESSDEDDVDENEPIIFLQDLETGPVLLNAISLARSTQDIFLILEEITIIVWNHVL